MTSRTTGRWPSLEPKGSRRGWTRSGAKLWRVESRVPPGDALVNPPSTLAHSRPDRLSPKQPPPGPRQPCARASPALCAWQPPVAALCIIVIDAGAPHHPVQRRRFQYPQSACSSSGRRRGSRGSVAAARRPRSGQVEQRRDGTASGASRRQRRSISVAPTEATDRGRGEARRSPSEASNNSVFTRGPDMVHRTGARCDDVQRRYRLQPQWGKSKRIIYSSRRGPSQPVCQRTTEARERQTRTERWQKATAKPEQHQ